MAAPIASVRAAPGNPKKRLRDGFKTLVTIEGMLDLEVWEVSVTPLGYQTEMIDQSTMWNDDFRTKFRKALIECTALKFTAAYSAFGLTILWNSMRRSNGGQSHTFTVTFPDASTIAFFGAIISAIPNELSEGDRPSMEITVDVSNLDEDSVEQPPVHGGII